MKKVARILERYSMLESGEIPGSIRSDFTQLVKQIPPRTLRANVASAFRSPATPSIQTIVADWYSNAPKQDRTIFLSQIKRLLRRQRLAHVVGVGKNPLKLLTVNSMNPQMVGRLFRDIEVHSPDIHEKLANQYVSSPNLLLHFEPSIQTEIIRSAAADPSLLSSDLGVASLPNEAIVLGTDPTPPEPLDQEATPKPRYGSIELFAESSAGEKGSAFGQDESFKQGRPFLAEVSIRVKPQGVKPAPKESPFVNQNSLCLLKSGSPSQRKISM